MNPVGINTPTLLAVGVIEQLFVYEPKPSVYFAGEIFAGEV